MAYRYLYQAIKGVPGLMGSGFSAQKQLYQKLNGGGDYRGTTTQNSWLLNQINQGNTGAQNPGMSKPQAKSAVAGNGLAQQYANMAGAGAVGQGPVFSQVLPFQQAWNQLLPTVTQEAHSQIDPFVNRQLGQDLGQYNMQLAGSGGNRFGRATGNLGSIGASAEQNRTAQINDWLQGRQQGFQQLFYNPAESSYNKALELGQRPNTPQVPTWDQFIKGINGGSNSMSTNPQPMKPPAMNNIYKPAY